MAGWSLETDGGIATLTFTQPPRNLISLAAMSELADALDDLAAGTNEASVVVLASGVDGFFIADADRDELAELAASEKPGELDGDPTAWCRALSRLESIPQPTVAAIDGVVGGGGCAIALACTLRVGSERAKLGPVEPFIGIVGSDSAQRLARLLGPAVSAELLLTSRILEADEARRIGLLNDLLPADGFPDQLRRWCERITRNPQEAVFAAKQAVLEGFAVTRDEALTIATAVTSAGPAAFARTR